MPALYIGHGAPPLLDDPVWSGAAGRLGAGPAAPEGDPDRQRALGVRAGHASAPTGAPLVYDFGGFDAKYYRMTYETPDATALAQRVAAMMPASEPVHQHASRGLDHGAWVPLRIMYPDADIPVLQMSLPTHDPVRLLALGERLRPLRDEGVLIIGSGFLTHGLPFLTEFRIDAAAPGWSTDFDAWAGEALARGDVDALARTAPRRRACPTPTRPSSTTRRCSSPSAPPPTPRSPASRSSTASGWGCRSGRCRSPEPRRREACVNRCEPSGCSARTDA